MDTTIKEINESDIKKYYKFLGHETITELRPISPRWKESKIPPISKFIKNADELIKEIKNFEEYNIYVGINERKEVGGKEDADVKFITNIGHDIDAHDNPEKKMIAGSIAMDIQMDCVKKGFQEPLVLDSGRGYWVMHHITPIENTEENAKKIKEFGKLIKKKFEIDGVKIDSTVYNPSRIARVPGTMNISDKEHPVMSKIINDPLGKEDDKLRNEILAIQIPVYLPNTLSTTSTSQNPTI